jgi:hypothetical protein
MHLIFISATCTSVHRTCYNSKYIFTVVQIYLFNEVDSLRKIHACIKACAILRALVIKTCTLNNEKTIQLMIHCDKFTLGTLKIYPLLWVALIINLLCKSVQMADNSLYLCREAVIHILLRSHVTSRSYTSSYFDIFLYSFALIFIVIGLIRYPFRDTVCVKLYKYTWNFNTGKFFIYKYGMLCF